MEKLEKVELLRSKTGVSYEQAKKALEANDYDVLESIVYLEALGEITGENIAKYSTSSSSASTEFKQAQEKYEKSCNTKTFGNMMDQFFAWCGKVLKKSCETTFEVTKGKDRILAVPVLVFVLALLFAFWLTIPLLIVGMFMDCKYRFLGFKNTSIDINSVCDKASEVCGNIKKEMKKDENKEDNSGNKKEEN